VALPPGPRVEWINSSMRPSEAGDAHGVAAVHGEDGSCDEGRPRSAGRPRFAFAFRRHPRAPVRPGLRRRRARRLQTTPGPPGAAGLAVERAVGEVAHAWGAGGHRPGSVAGRSLPEQRRSSVVHGDYRLDTSPRRGSSPPPPRRTWRVRRWSWTGLAATLWARQGAARMGSTKALHDEWSVGTTEEW